MIILNLKDDGIKLTIPNIIMTISGTKENNSHLFISPCDFSWNKIWKSIMEKIKATGIMVGQDSIKSSDFSNNVASYFFQWI